MTLIEAAILGIVQGLTEFLPISSSGHLVLFQRLFGMQEGTLILDTMLHLGTLIAVLVIFWEDVIHIIKHPFDRLTLLLVAGTIPTAIIGLAFKDFFERLFDSGATLGVEFLMTGAVLILAERLHAGRKQMADVTYTDAVIIGVLQGAAILPAVSRSGLTIAGSLFRGIDREVAARFSFLLSIPAILGAAVLQTKDLMADGIGDASLLSLAVGTAFSAVAGYLAIKVMIRMLQRGSLKVFTYYVWVLGLCIIVAQLMGKF